MTVLVTTSPGIGTRTSIMEIHKKLGFDTVELRINSITDVDDIASALDAAGNLSKNQTLLVDIDNGATPELLTTLLSCLETKTMCGRSIEAMTGAVVVIRDDEFSDVQNHPLVSSSVNVNMKVGQKGSFIALESAVGSELGLDEKAVDIPMARIEREDMMGTPFKKEDSDDPSLT